MEVFNENSQSEREQLSQDIERIKQALQDSGEADSDSESDVDSFVLKVDTDWDEDDEADEEEQPPINDAASKRGIQVDDGHASGDPILKDSLAVQLSLQEDGQLPNDTETCLALNRAYQEMLMENLKNIELQLVKNRETQTQLKHELESDAEDRLREVEKKKPLSVYAMPYFRDVDGKIPPINYDTQLKKASQTLNEIIKPNRIWVQTEKRHLTKAVKQNAMQQLMRPIMNKKEREEDKRDSGVKDEEKSASLIQQYDLELIKIKNMSIEELFGPQTNIIPIDWLKISSTDMNGTRSAQNCELMWYNALHPAINTSRWNAVEDAKLQDLITKYDGHNWLSISAELNTKRTPFQCLQRYQTRLSPLLQTGKWSNEEDKVLDEVIQNVRESHPGSEIPWDQVAYFMEGRSWEQCKERWNMLHPMEGHRRGKWSSEEDLMLIEAVGRFGFINWQKVKEFVPGRTSHQCRERWKNCLDLEVKFATWSYQEDKALWQTTEKYGEGRWSEICEHIPGRLDQPCLKRYRMLKKWQEQEKLMKDFSKSVLPKKKEFPSLSEFLKRELQKIQDNCNQGKLERMEDEISLLETDLKAMASSSIYTNAILEEQSFGQPKKTLLEVLRHRYKEQKIRFEQEEALIAEDRKNGIFIPRPPLGNQVKSGVLIAQVRRRNHLHHLVQERIQRAKDSGHGLNIKAESDVARIIGGEKLPFVKGEVYEKALKLMQAATVEEMEQVTSKLKHHLLYRGRRKPPGRPSHSKEEIEIDNKLLRLMRTRVSTSRRVGRPRKYLSEAISSKKPLTTVISEPISLKVGRLMMQAMNLDMEGSVKATLRHTPIGQLQSVSQDTATAAISVTGDVGLFVKSMASDFFRLQQQILRTQKKQDKSSAPNSQSSDASSNKYSNSSEPSSIEPQDTISGETSARRPDTPPPRQQRSKLTGLHATRMYNMPPLPPTCATLNAFKNLLLNRRSLVHTAKRYHVPGELGTHPIKRPTRRPNGNSADQSQINSQKHLPTGDLTRKNIYKPIATDVGNPENNVKDSVNSKTRNSTLKTTGVHNSIHHANPVGNTDHTNSTAKQSSEHTECETSFTRAIKTFDGEKNFPSSSKKSDKFHFITLYPADINLPILSSLPAKEINLVKKLFKTKSNIRMKVPANMDLDELEKTLGRSLDNNEDGPHDIPDEEVKPLEKKCGSIIKRIRSTHDYQLLKARFNTLFLWPALLSTVVPTTSENGETDADTEKQVLTSTSVEDIKPANKYKTGSRPRNKKMRFPCTRGKKYRRYLIKPKDEKEKFLEICRIRSNKISAGVADDHVAEDHEFQSTERRPKRGHWQSSMPKKPPSSRVKELVARRETVEAEKRRIEAEVERIQQEEIRIGRKRKGKGKQINTDFNSKKRKMFKKFEETPAGIDEIANSSHVVTGSQIVTQEDINHEMGTKNDALFVKEES